MTATVSATFLRQSHESSVASVSVVSSGQVRSGQVSRTVPKSHESRIVNHSVFFSFLAGRSSQTVSHALAQREPRDSCESVSVCLSGTISWLLVQALLGIAPSSSPTRVLDKLCFFLGTVTVTISASGPSRRPHLSASRAAPDAIIIGTF